MKNELLISSDAKNMIGTETELSKPFKIEKGAVLRFIKSIEGMNTLSTDEERINKNKPIKVLVPAIFLNYHVPSGNEREITQKIPSTVHRRIRAKDEIELIHPIYVGDTIRARTKMIDIFEKEGKTSRLVFIITETEYINQHDIVVRRHRITSIRR